MRGLDLAAGARTCVKELYGDWYRDPWGWPEFHWAAENSSKIQSTDVLRTEKGTPVVPRNPAHFDLIEVPKNSLAVRPAVVMDPLSRLLYAAAAHPNLPKLHSKLPDWVYGWRNRNASGFANNSREWTNYRSEFDGLDDTTWGLSADITSFFASINVDRAEETLYQTLGKNAATSVLADVIRHHDALTTRSGLPQRSFISAAVAHLMMAPIDDVLTAFLKRSSGSKVSRWMDDLNAAGPADELYALHLELEERARQIGLELNASKSKLCPLTELRGALAVEGITELTFTRTVGGEYGEQPTVVEDIGPIKSIEDAILSNALGKPAWLLKAVLVTLRKARSFDRLADWTNVAHLIPHAADSLGRYLKDAYRDTDPWVFSISDWVANISETKWATLNWISAQWALSIPNSAMGPRYIASMERWLESSTDPQQLAIAGQRLAIANPAGCRDIIRARVDHVHSPLLLRIMALSLLGANDDRGAIRSILRRDPRNLVLLSALDDQGWTPPAVSQDFDEEKSDPDDD
jgi:hypothetical protein